MSINLYIYDIEVFSDDWIVVFRKPENDDYKVFHNNNYELKNWLLKEPDIIGGFNNKHYDDYILMTMLNGGSNVEVKRCNDFIIEGNKPWEFPIIQFKKKPFKSFDLRDDIPDKGISLKAIEGNLGLPIVESSVPFDINRPLTRSELEEAIRYCKYDVDSSCRLYQERKEDYLGAKVLAGSMYGIEPLDAMGYTNARLSAEALQAKYTEYDDERDYKLPPNLPPERIPKIVLDFFMQITDKTIPDAKLFGAGSGSKGMTLELMLKSGGGECPVTYAWGGVHGAKPCITIEETDDRVIINQDVASLYPNSMINFGYTSRSMADPDAYRKLVERRLKYKHDGDKKKANSLKLIINTCYGAMLSKGNGLNDRLGGRSVCITNQLAMSILISDLAKACSSIDFVNINTDGVMFTINRNEIELSERVVSEWCELTGFEMERDDFNKVIQKDVNNYIGIKEDGSFKTKGGYVSLYNGGNFKTNSLQIIDKAIVDYLVKGIDPEVTINECTDILAFQQIVKTGNTYQGSYHYIEGEALPIQKVNRVYAVKDKCYGQIVKGKWITEKRKKNKDTGKMESTPVEPPIWQETIISECPTHAYVDNENKLKIEQLDLDYYITMTKKRIDKYLNMDKSIERKLKKIDKEVVIMATTKLNVYQKLNEARVKFAEADVKKSGINSYAEFDYFKLEDIIPIKTTIFNDVGLTDAISFDNELGVLRLYNSDNPEEHITFTSPLAPDESLIKNPIQKVGAVQTYVRRYLYLMVLDIVEDETIDAVTDAPDKVNKTKKSAKPKTAEERKEIADELIDAEGEASDTQIKSVKKGLKQLRALGDYEDYIKESLRTIKGGISKTDADALLIEIGDMIVEAEK